MKEKDRLGGVQVTVNNGVEKKTDEVAEHHDGEHSCSGCVFMSTGIFFIA